jgi:hypothetical protein
MGGGLLPWGPNVSAGWPPPAAKGLAVAVEEGGLTTSAKRLTQALAQGTQLSGHHGLCELGMAATMARKSLNELH